MASGARWLRSCASAAPPGTPRWRRSCSGPDVTPKSSVALFSLEMSAEQLATRLLSEESRISGDRIRRVAKDALDVVAQCASQPQDLRRRWLAGKGFGDEAVRSQVGFFRACGGRRAGRSLGLRDRHSGRRAAADIRPLVRVSITVIAEQNGRRESGYAGGGGRYGYAELLGGDRPERLAREALRQALVNLEAVDAPAGTLPVVLGPVAVEAAGRALELQPHRRGPDDAFQRVQLGSGHERFLVAAILRAAPRQFRVAQSRGIPHAGEQGARPVHAERVDQLLAQQSLRFRVHQQHAVLVQPGAEAAGALPGGHEQRGALVERHQQQPLRR